MWTDEVLGHLHRGTKCGSVQKSRFWSVSSADSILMDLLSHTGGFCCPPGQVSENIWKHQRLWTCHHQQLQLVGVGTCGRMYTFFSPVFSGGPPAALGTDPRRGEPTEPTGDADGAWDDWRTKHAIGTLFKMFLQLLVLGSLKFSAVTSSLFGFIACI